MFFCSNAGHKIDLPSESRLDLTVLRGYELNSAIMGPSELEEFQGFSVGALQVWLVERGWRDITTPRQSELGRLSFAKEAHCDLSVFSLGSVADTSTSSGWLYLVADAAKLPLQELLRQVNPRLRSGWPSEDDLKTHEWWLVNCPLLDNTMRVWESDAMRERKERVPNAVVECWPVDAAGNKVRWK